MREMRKGESFTENEREEKSECERERGRIEAFVERKKKLKL